MAAFMRKWIGLDTSTQCPSNTDPPPTSSKSVPAKKRTHTDLTGNDEDQKQVAPSNKKRVKRPFVDISNENDDDSDIIVVAHRPLRELHVNQSANSNLELSREEFERKARRKLYVKPVPINSEDVAEYSNSPSPRLSTKTSARNASKPKLKRALKKPAVKSKSSSTSARKFRPSKAQAQPRVLTDLPTLLAHNSSLLKRSNVSARETVNLDSDDGDSDGDEDTPAPQGDNHSVASEEPSSRRGSRRVPRTSYKNMDLAESEDELVAATAPGRNRGKLASKPPRRRKDDDEAFVIERDEETESDFDDEAQLDHDIGEGSSDVSFDEEEVEEADEPRAKPVKPSRPSKTKDDGSDSNPKSTGSRSRMVNLKSGKAEEKSINYALPPLFEIEDIFRDLTSKACRIGFDQVVKGLAARPIRVATMCSGTESPLLALEMITDCLSKSNLPVKLKIEHLFSAEIVPFKQAYIERNFNPPIIFRDITELTSVVDEDDPVATTAYGGKAPVPKEVDMVIAGTSCVDFSGLNTYRKTMSDGGESADTWHAVLSYCRVFRPAIVLLENVSLADWNRMISDYENIDYECSGASVNTRDYYLPQIRERGYMACFNKQLPGYVPGSADRWAKRMADFKRPASSPTTEFLVPNDQIVQKIIRNDEPSREVDWKQCQITQMEYRQDNRLGWARPITNWSESGWLLAPDNGNPAWYNKQVERVLDTIDCAVLRKALAMYDCRFKTRILDLSQNVYREKDHRPFGICGCITPSGIYFVTDLGRTLTSEELLKLQGIPLQKISFTTESQSEIQSLAGNAMSSTVIGASILSALLAGHGTIKTQGRGSRCQPAVADRKLIAGAGKPAQAMNLSGGLKMDVLLQKAEMATRRCYCEGTSGTAVKPIQQCEDCGHTTCTSCGGNPAHQYRQNNSLSENRMSPAEFKDFVQSVIPLRLSFSAVDLRQLDKMWPCNEYGEAVATAMRGSFAFSSTRRTHCWTITYTSDKAVLELVLSPTTVFHAELRLYAVPSKALPGNSPLRQMLEQPVARSALLDATSSGLATCSWSVRIPGKKPKALPLTITGSGLDVASWWSRMEMPSFSQHTLPSVLNIQVGSKSNSGMEEDDVSGKYQYLPRCGKACSSLYKRIESNRPMFLFLDPTRMGEPEKDCFVFSQSIDLLEKAEVRPVFARISPSWRPWKAKGISKATIPTFHLLVDESWHKMPGCTLSGSEMQVTISGQSDLAALLDSAKCSELAMLISCNLPDNDSSVSHLSSGTEKRIVRADDARFFETHTWIFEAMRRLLPASGWRDLEDSHTGARCEYCAPSRPALRWGLSEDGTDLKSYEDPRGAALYERSIKARPDPIAVVVTNGGLTFSLGVDVASIAHRAGARLPRDLPISYQWRFTANGQPEFKFTPFKLTDTTGVLPYSKDLPMDVNLFPKQLMSLGWMKTQELGVEFDIEEGEEACIDALGWKAEVRATSTKTIRGGICADHPGFGKTITSLALICSDFRESTAERIRAEITPRAHGLLPHAGTLIVCPSSLVEQWADETRKKLKYSNLSLCVVKTMADLSKHTISSFQEFNIVVINRSLFSNDAYIERLAAFAGIPGPISSTSKGRPFVQWQRFAQEQIPEHLKVMRSGLANFKRHIEKVYKDHVNSEDFKAAVPSKRLTGADYIAGKTKSVKAGDKVKAQSSVSTAHLDKPLFHLFHWNRIIVDEFHQAEAKLANIAVASMRPDKCWGLSATPAMGDFFEVARMGELIGVPLRIGSDGNGMMRAASVRELRKDMTHFELFDAMRKTPSDTMHSRIHENDQKFLDTFVRQNIMDHDQLQYVDHLVTVALDLYHGALYTELSQHLNSADMRIRKKTKVADRDKHFNEAVSTSASAEEALSKVAAFSNRDGAMDDSDDNEEINAFDLLAVVRTRQAAVDKILRKIPDAMSEAQGTEAGFAKYVKSRLADGTLGDVETSQQLLKLASAAKSVKITAATLKSRRERKEDYGTGTRALTAHLNGLCNRLLLEKRSARYVQNLHRFLQVAPDDHIEITCDDRKCATIQTLDVAISALCGHLICRTCYMKKRASEDIKCCSPGCSSPMADHHLFWPNKLGNLLTNTPYGAKIDAAVKLLKTIEEKNEQAILFVQFENQLGEVEMALEDAGISATIVENVDKAGDQIQMFRAGAGKAQQKTVIVLNSSDETAAGSNLQNANHVIFLSPLLKDTQYGYDSTMAQTIGRVRRHGQQKEINIYRIVALDTIDVDILEQRERRSDALIEQGAPKIKRPSWLPGKTSAKERTQLVRGEDGHFSLQPQSW